MSDPDTLEGSAGEGGATGGPGEAGETGEEPSAVRPAADAPPLSPEDRELFASLPEEMARLLYPDQLCGPVEITLDYPEVEGEDAGRARELEATARQLVVDEPRAPGEPPRHRARFTLQELEEFHELYHLVERRAGSDRVEIRVNGHDLPLVRELWLPLLWTLRS